jgi:hypothetical protein
MGPHPSPPMGPLVRTSSATHCTPLSRRLSRAPARPLRLLLLTHVRRRDAHSQAHLRNPAPTQSTHTRSTLLGEGGVLERFGCQRTVDGMRDGGLGRVGVALGGVTVLVEQLGLLRVAADHVDLARALVEDGGVELEAVVTNRIAAIYGRYGR